jgi:DAK2 domain fusion protein YloV
MSVKEIDVDLFKKMVINGAINLKNNHAEVDALNVFPVPDGDTGTNMSMTITSGVRELENCESSSIIENAKVLSRGALMGARGNSGVILSQFFRGIYVGLKEIQHNYLTIEEFMNCLLSGRKIAYKAVMAPVEGTILTVVREAAENTESHLNEFDTIDALLEFYYNEAEKTLANTPELLPVLKEAGVVDSGGAGFCKIIEGMLMALKGEILEAKEAKPQEDEASDAAQEIKFAYCTEFILDLRKPDTFEERELTATLSLLGDSLVVIRDTKTVKVHIHTNRPGRVLEIAQKSGEFQTLKIENMHLQHSHLEEGAKGAKAPEAPKANEPKKEFALIAVCFGDGIVNTFKELGVDYVIEGGQTMNPSTEAFVSAIKAVNAKNVIIIPNNGNVVMAAKQAAGMVRGSKVEVILAKTIAQGYASLINYNPEATMEENLEAMGESIAHVKSGEVTYSVRDTEINGVKIVAGDYMGIADGEIIVSVKEEKDAVKGLLEKMIDEESEIATFFCGKDVTEEEKALVEEMCLEINKNLDVEIIDGNQDIYSYIIAVE